jgi:hypothetical protein
MLMLRVLRKAMLTMGPCYNFLTATADAASSSSAATAIASANRPPGVDQVGSFLRELSSKTERRLTPLPVGRPPRAATNSPGTSGQAP